MAIPDYQECMLPLLEVLADGQDYQLRVVTRTLADRFNLSESERAELLPSKSQTVIANRVAWAKTYLKMAGLLTQPSRGAVQVTDQGRAVLQKKPARIDNEFLRQYPTFNEFFDSTAPETAGGSPRLLPRRR